VIPRGSTARSPAADECCGPPPPRAPWTHRSRLIGALARESAAGRRRARPGATLVVAGSGPVRHWSAAGVRAGTRRAPRMLAAADALLLTSCTEGTPGRARSSRRPPVVDVGAVRSAVVDGSTGRVASRDPAVLAPGSTPFSGVARGRAAAPTCCGGLRHRRRWPTAGRPPEVASLSRAPGDDLRIASLFVEQVVEHAGVVDDRPPGAPRRACRRPGGAAGGSSASSHAGCRGSFDGVAAVPAPGSRPCRRAVGRTANRRSPSTAR
jgi:hypothetical protein